MIGIIMAGGRGSRMKSDTEKPLIQVGDKTMLERVAEALIKAELKVLVAVSQYTPNTALNARKMGLGVVKSPGKGYVEDIQFLLRELRLDNALVVSADLPFISPGLIRSVVKKYSEVKKPICVAVREAEYHSMGFTPSTVLQHSNESLVPVGVNVVEKEEGDDYFYLASGREVVNVNTCEELEFMRNLL